MLGRLGVVVNSDGTYSVPGYCSWMPFSSYTQACKPPTQEEFLNDQRASLGPAAKANPALVKETEAAWRDAYQLSCRSNPEQCAEYEYAVEHPDLSATWGMRPGVRTLTSWGEEIVDLPQKLASSPNLLLIGGLVVGGLLLFLLSPSRTRVVLQ